MSIQILLEPESKNNKSLDLYCNTIDANDLKMDNVDCKTLTVANTLYPETYPLQNAISVMSGVNGNLKYAVSPYVFLNSLPQTYNINGTPQTVGGDTTSTKGLSSSYIAICDNSLYSYDFVFQFTSGVVGTVIASLVLNNTNVLTITQSIPLGTANYYRIFGQFQSYGGWGTPACDLMAVLQAEYQDNSTPLKETLFTTSKSGLNNVPYLNTELVPVEIKLSSSIPITLMRVMGNIKCEYNDFSQNGPF